MPKYAGLYTYDDKYSMSIKVLENISYYCSKTFIDKIFDKNITKLIATRIITDIKDLDILISISSYTDIRSRKID